MSRKLVMLSCLIFMLAGCANRLIDFTIISSKNVDFAKADKFKKGTKRVKGEDITLIIIFPLGGPPNIKEAIDRAIEKVPGAIALVDGVISHSQFQIPFFGRNAWVAEGTPLIDTTLIGQRKLKSNYMLSFVEKKSGDQKLVYIKKDRYLEIKELIKRDDKKSVYKILQKLLST